MNQISTYDSGEMTPQLPAMSGDVAFRVEIDIQVSTANAYPRKLSRVAGEIRDLVTITPEAAAACVYTLPRDGKAITGPSIRLAEILFACWGNCTGGSRITEVNRAEGYVEAEGAFWDLQKNAKTVRRFRRRITNKQGKVFSDDMIIVTGQAAGSIAFRNAVLGGIPRAIWNEAYEAAEEVIRGTMKTLGERHDASMKVLHAFGFTADDVYKVLGIGGRQEFSLDHIVTLTGLYTTLKDGATTKEQIMRDIDVVDATPARTAGSISQRATATGPAQTTTQEKPQPKTNPAADAALEAEAKRVAEKREADAKAKADADAKAKTDRQAAAEQRAADDRAEAQKQHEEDVAQREAAAKQTAADLEAADRAQATEDEGHTEEAEQADAGGIATDPASLESYYDAIMSDLFDDMPVDVAKKGHADKIAAIEAADPAMHARLMDEMNAA